MRHPVEVKADEAHLVRWLAKRVGADVRAPALGALGWRLMGGRLLPDHGLPAAQFMYEDASGRRLTLYVRKETGLNNTSFRFHEQDGFGSFYWIDRPLAYALSGRLSRDELMNLANTVYAQLEAQDAGQGSAGRASRNSGSVGRWLVFVVDRHAIAVSGLDAGLDARIGGQALHQPCSQHDNADDHEECRHVLLHAHPVAGVVRMRAVVTGRGACQRWRRLDGRPARNRERAALSDMTFMSVIGCRCARTILPDGNVHAQGRPTTCSRLRAAWNCTECGLPAACARARSCAFLLSGPAGTINEFDFHRSRPQGKRPCGPSWPCCASIGPVSACRGAFQDFDAEIADLPGAYAPPAGQMLFLRDPADHALAGCVAVRPCARRSRHVRDEAPLSASCRARKRPRPPPRPCRDGRGTAAGLPAHVPGYASQLEEAQTLYRSLGFRQVGTAGSDPVVVLYERDITLP